MTDIAAFISARLGEAEAAAKACADYDGGLGWYDSPVRGSGDHTIRAAGSNVAVCRVRLDDGTGDEGVPRLLDADAVAEHIARHDPARVLREVAAGRLILAEHEHTDHVAVTWIGASGEKPSSTPWGCLTCHEDDGVIAPYGWCKTVRAVASAWSDHEQFAPSWAAL